MRRAPQGEGVSKKIQAICNGKSTPSAMQRLAIARENPSAQEQWEAMEKAMGSNERTMGRAMETVGNPGECLHPVVGARQATTLW
jgi:hypothetical protein